MVCKRVVLAALAAGVAEGNPCVTDLDYEPSTKYQEDGEEKMCGTEADWTQGFNAEEKCGDTVPDEDYTYAQVFAHLGNKCCVGRPPLGSSEEGDVCAQYGNNFCKVKGDYTPGKVASTDDQSGETTNCALMFAIMPAFVPSKKTCDESIELGDESRSRDFWLSWFAESCCSGKEHVCTGLATEINPCASAGDYTPDANAGGYTCKMGVGILFNAEPTAKTCAEKAEHDGEMMAKSAILEDVADDCCSGKATKCEAIAEEDANNSSNKSSEAHGAGPVAVLLAGLVAVAVC